MSLLELKKTKDGSILAKARTVASYAAQGGIYKVFSLFFTKHKPPEAVFTDSFLSDEQVNSVYNTINSLTGKIYGSWRFTHIEQKKTQVKALNDLLTLVDTKPHLSIHEAIGLIMDKHGVTKDLFYELENLGSQMEIGCGS